MSKKKSSAPPASRRPEPKNRTKRSYQHKIPDRNALQLALEREARPMAFDEIAAAFGLKTRKQQQALTAVLTRMLQAGQLHLNRSEQYLLTAKTNLITGTVVAHKDGYGFLQPDGDGDDLYLAPRQMQRIMHGDRVAGREHRRNPRGPEGKVLEVLERAHTEVAGRYVRERGIGLAAPC